MGPSLDRSEVRGEVEEATARGCDGLALLPGVEALLRDALARGLRRAVASSSSCAWVEGWLGRHRVRDLIDVVVGRDHVRKVKPDPELFLLAARRLDVPPASCLVFEDSPNGMRAALAAGMRCVAVPTGLTRALARPEVDLVLGSLDERPLAAILEAVAAGDLRARGASAGPPKSLV